MWDIREGGIKDDPKTEWGRPWWGKFLGGREQYFGYQNVKLE